MDVIGLEYIFWEQPYFETKELHTILTQVLCANSNFTEKFEQKADGIVLGSPI